MWVELVVGSPLCFDDFFPGSLVSPSPQKSTSNSNCNPMEKEPTLEATGTKKCGAKLADPPPQNQ